MARVQRSGYTQRRGVKTKRLMTDVGICVRYKLDRIAEVQGDSKNGALNNILREGLAEYNISSWDTATQESAEKAAFIVAYIKEHFGENPEDEIAATAAALDAYHQKVGYRFQSDEETFILPQ